MGRATEAVDRTLLCELTYPILLGRWQRKEMNEQQVVATVAACAEGYAFPTNLDLDPPVDGPVPASQSDVLIRALESTLSAEDFALELAQHSARRLA